MERIQEQIRTEFRRAFYDTIAIAVAQQPPDVDYLVRLFTEIRDRLAQFTRPNSRSFHKIHEDLDVDFFRQRLTHNAFDGHSLQSLVMITFDWIKALQAPSRDSDTEAAKQRVLASGTTMAQVVPCYIRETHACIDTMQNDMREFLENQQHPVVQEALRQTLRRR